MAQTSVAQFASELKVPPSVLLEQLRAAGVDKKQPDDPLSEQDKSRLLEYLRKMPRLDGAEEQDHAHAQAHERDQEDRLDREVPHRAGRGAQEARVREARSGGSRRPGGRGRSPPPPPPPPAAPAVDRKESSCAKRKRVASSSWPSCRRPRCAKSRSASARKPSRRPPRKPRQRPRPRRPGAHHVARAEAHHRRRQDRQEAEEGEAHHGAARRFGAPAPDQDARGLRRRRAAGTRAAAASSPRGQRRADDLRPADRTAGARSRGAGNHHRWASLPTACR